MDGGIKTNVFSYTGNGQLTVLVEIVRGGRNLDVTKAPINFYFPAWPSENASGKLL